jgi:hypothetical protein
MKKRRQPENGRKTRERERKGKKKKVHIYAHIASIESIRIGGCELTKANRKE